MTKAVLGYGQTLFDFGIQEFGSAEGAFSAMVDNPTIILSANWQPVAGTILQVKSEPTDARVLAYYKKNSLKPASGNELQPNNPEPVYLQNIDGTILRNVDGTPLQNIVL